MQFISDRSSAIYRCFWLAAATVFIQGPLGAKDAISIDKIDRKEPVLFNSEILPILRTNCVACHSSTKARGDINLESVKAILEGGEDGPIVVPGKSADSILIKAAAHQSKPIMPPKKNKVGARALTPRELGLLALWIDQGAKDEGPAASAVKVEWHPLPSGSHPIYATAVRFDGKIAACARANQVFVYGLDAGAVITRLTDPALIKDGPYKRPGIAHLDSVQSLAFSPDGETLASGGFRCIKIWKHQKGVALGKFSVGDSPVTCVDSSLVSGLFATGHGDGKVRVQDASGKQVAEVQAASEAIVSLSLSLDGKSVCVLTKGEGVSFWALEGGAKTGNIPLAAPATSVTYLLADASVATGGEDGTVSVWNVSESTGAKPGKAEEGGGGAAPAAAVKELKGHQKKITCLVSISRDGGQLASGSEDGSVRIWDAAGGKQVREIKHGSPVRSAVARKAGDRIAITGDAPGATLWDLATGKEIAKLQEDPALLRSTSRKERQLKLSKDRIASQKKSREGDVKNLEGKKNAQKKSTEAVAKAKKARDDKNKVFDAAKAGLAKKIEEAEKGAKAAQVALDQAVKTGGEKDKLLEAAKNAPDKQKVEAAENAAKAAQVAFDQAVKDRDGKAAALAEAKKGQDKDAVASAEKEAKAAEGSLAGATKEKDAKAKAVEVAKKSRDAKKIQAAANEVKAAKAEVAKATKARNEKNKALEAAKKNPDKKNFDKADKEAKAAQSTLDSAERTLVESGKDVKKAEDQVKTRDEAIKVAEAGIAAPEKDLADAKALQESAKKPVSSIAFSGDGQFVFTLGENKVLATWSAQTGQGMHSSAAEGRLISPTVGGLLVLQEKGSVEHVAPVGNWVLDKTLGSPDSKSPLIDRILSLDFSPDGKHLAAGGGEASRTGELSVWNIDKGELVWRLEDAHSDTVFAVDYSAEGSYIATGGADKFARTFKAADGAKVRFYEGHTAHVLGVSWQSGSDILASCGADNVIKIWDFRTGDVKRTIGGFSKQVSSVSFIGDTQETLSCSGDKSVKMHRANDGNNFRNLAGAGDYMYSADVTPDATVVVAGGYDSVLHVWNGKDGKARFQLKPPELKPPEK